ncbi:hypothetical protein ES703_38329 [subsurface metagenome]
MSLKFADKRNVDLRQQLMLCRQKSWTVVFCAQSSRDIDESIIRQSNCTIYKEPGLNAANSERREIRVPAIKATQIFKQLPKEERQRVACVFDENFEGIIQCNLPTFWSEELSNTYGYLGSSDISGQNSSQRIYRSTPGNKPRLSSARVSDEEILKLRRKDYGYERIAKTLGCTVYRARRCLAAPERTPSVHISLEHGPEDTILDDYVDSALESFPDYWASFNLISKSKVTLGDTPAYEIVFTGISNLSPGYTSRCKYLVGPRGTQGFFGVMATSSPALFQQHESIINQVIYSFRPR